MPHEVARLFMSGACVPALAAISCSCEIASWCLANLDTRSLVGGSRDGRQMAREDHSWAWPANLGTLGSHCPSSNGLEDLGSPTSPELTQVS